ncbi:DUF4440 domain-containing protein [Haloimpatiens sp. FM7330]|uniref:nuclear transport factor 2 family protein n=1 Tax=Haloimpatiens sp. FM7330 TaxID=3298610 RepID=UPI00363B542C
MESIEKNILQLESDLLKAETRKSSQKINQILANDFIEFCSSGSEYHYKNGDVFQAQNDNDILCWEILDFKIKKLSNDCILAMYKVVKNNEIDENKKYSLRSSIWKYYNGKWKMVFHQGTLSSKSKIEDNLLGN